MFIHIEDPKRNIYESDLGYIPSHFQPSFYKIMNIYARYFDQETLVYSFDELMEFLSSIPEIPVSQRLADDVRSYLESDMPYPRRYKIRPRVYFILIKTPAKTMDEFKNNRKDENGENVDMRYDNHPTQAGGGVDPASNFSKKDIKIAKLAQENYGWYYCSIAFKRVIQIANTTKFRYQDTNFTAYIKANSGNECYAKMVEHLKSRPEVDLRSQFPSAKGSNFKFEYVGTTIPTE